MADAPKDSDQSMEDILQSIKRIIADENETPPSAPTGSDVLELTDLLAEDVAVPEVPPSAPPEPVAEPVSAPEVSTMSIDEIMSMPITPEPVLASPSVVVEPEPEPQPLAEPEPQVPAEAVGSLMSESAVAASAAALSALSHRADHHVGHDTPVFRSGTTVEDLVLESLRPMLKDWLDSNLPAMVRQMVEREIRRISSGL